LKAGSAENKWEKCVCPLELCFSQEMVSCSSVLNYVPFPTLFLFFGNVEEKTGDQNSFFYTLTKAKNIFNKN
jgi:hypothetical protein